eukprot:TRINITY_DN17450_c0_g2_i1.p1 TRINITY_DN17450_c0_g2~~TRINITY_DN17450_c0_g2_i1.p1  ORF type:complete len:202 (+),score=53.68 TRINITY_DN17450_c0_g2_i1:58-606(+)
MEDILGKKKMQFNNAGTIKENWNDEGGRGYEEEAKETAVVPAVQNSSSKPSGGNKEGKSLWAQLQENRDRADFDEEEDYRGQNTRATENDDFEYHQQIEDEKRRQEQERDRDVKKSLLAFEAAVEQTVKEYKQKGLDERLNSKAFDLTDIPADPIADLSVKPAKRRKRKHQKKEEVGLGLDY